MNSTPELRARMAWRIGLAAINLLAACGIAFAVGSYVSAGSDDYASASPYLCYNFSGISDEGMLVDYCLHLRSIRGITAVSYRDFEPRKGRAMLVVYYNPHEASAKFVRILLDHSSVVWVTPKST
ncbi:MAG: hypothetical protein JST22_16840 [Bacteroidetes bacterium]|nr:hypothetical protein [Bacteroidota bacterium]